MQLSGSAELQRAFSLHFSQLRLNVPENVAAILPEKCVVGEWACQVDVPALHKEAQSLLRVTPGQSMTRQECMQHFRSWAKQQRFMRADVVFKIRDDGVVDATVSFIAATIMESITVSGTLIGKDKYRHSYLIRPGELFNEELHQAGLQKIKDVLRQEGFLGAIVTDNIHHNDSYRTVNIALHIQQGPSYRINKTALNLAIPIDELDHDQARVMALVRRQLDKKLEKAVYDSSLIESAIAQVKKTLADHGFMGPVIKLQEKIDHRSQEIELVFQLNFGSKNLFIWYGNRFFSCEQLLDQLLNFGSSLTLIPPALLAEELVSLYKKHGFWDVHITWREDGSRTYFFINEGLPAIIDSITINGATSFLEKKLVKSYGSSVEGAPFSAEKIKTFLSHMTDHYMHAGFWDVAIEGYEYIPKEKNHYTLNIVLHEGEQRWLARVVCDVDSLDIPELTISIPKPFDVRFIQEQRQLIVRALRCQGKLYANPVPELHEESPRQIAVYWKIEGIVEPIRFGKTVVVGNGSFNCDHILRECAYQEGDVWNGSKIDATVARLRRLGIFDVVSLVPDDISVSEPVKDVILQCVPDSLFEVRSRLGVQGVNRNIVRWNGGASPKLGLSFLARNPAHICDLLRLDVDYTRYMHDINAQYRIPWIGDYRAGLELQLISSRYDQPVYIGSPAVLYRASHDGLVIGSSKNYGPLSGGVSLSVAQIGLKATSCDCCTLGSVDCRRAGVIAHALNVDRYLLCVAPWYVMLEGTCVIDLRDDKVNPHAGSLTVVALKGVAPPVLAYGSFIKGLFEHSWFTSVWYDIVAGFRVRAGMIGGARFNRIMPMERFYLGGPYSLRCYESDYAPALSSFLTCSNNRCLVPTGGKYMANINFELRVPLYKRLGGVFFLDGGSLSCNPGALVCPDNFMGAVGFGLRVHTPVGPLRSDIGWRLHHDRDIHGAVFNARRFAWFITLGQAF